MFLTDGAKLIIKTLNDCGFEAYAVGGAVRNGLLGLPILDIDITTSATPSEMKEVFKDFNYYETGIKHGTLTVLVNKEHYEVTTYRLDGDYFDSRHPSSVKFVRNLSEDLKRRDFTVNAMAYDHKSGVIDLFSGQEDLKNKVIRAVGNPEERFQEDALRILRAMRFASVLGFSVEPKTAKAAVSYAHLLKKVSVERIYAELTKLILGQNAESVLLEFKEVIFAIIPRLKKCDGFLQYSKYHHLDVYMHMVKSLANSCQDKVVRWALLLHDIEKPSCFTKDQSGAGHFKGHEEQSAITAREILLGLKAEKKMIDQVFSLILIHDLKILGNSAQIKNLLFNYGYDLVYKLLNLQKGDARAHVAKHAQVRLSEINDAFCVLDKIIKNNECYTLKQLKINGKDLTALGYKGQEIKEKLNKVLFEVINGNLDNDKAKLLKRLENDG